MGLGMPRAMAGMLQGFPYIAGSASALMGFCQMGTAVLSSLAVSRIEGDHHLILGIVFAACALLCLVAQRLVLPRPPAEKPPAPPPCGDSAKIPASFPTPSGPLPRTSYPPSAPPPPP